MSADESTAPSAIRASLTQKGSNSYYYAWNKLDLSREAEFRPRLLGSSVNSKNVSLDFIRIDKYAWCDDGINISVYLDVAGVHELSREGIVSEFLANSVMVNVCVPGDKIRRLFLTNLDGGLDAEQCKIHIKRDRIIVKLRKLEPDQKWYKLCKK